MSENKSAELKIKVAELTSVADIDSNLSVILEHIGDKADFEIIFFPENSLLIRIDSGTPFEGIDFQGPEIKKIEAAARERGVFVVLGSVPLRSDSGRFKNATVVVDADGRSEIVYIKSHLFDVKLEDGSEYLESKDYEYGEGPKTLDILGWKFGLSICYDLRFSNFYLKYALDEVDAILVPSAFTVPTGKAHWEVLLRARAIESQCYVIAAAQVGHHGGKRHSYGDSMVVDPWGKILDRSEKPRQSFCLTLKRSEIERVRKQIPMKIHRRDFS